MKIHFERTRTAFDLWVRSTGADRPRPNEPLEEVIRESNIGIRDLVVSNWSLIPPEYQEDAHALLRHYQAWLEEYDRVRPGGVRDPEVPYVFVGPKGFPFPVEAETRFLALYERLTEESRSGSRPG
jgi:hypothetical protein